MQKLKNVIIVLALAVLVHFGYTVVAPKAAGHVGDTSIPTMFSPMSNSQVVCASNTSTLLVGTSTSRAYLRLSNTGSSTAASVWLSFGTPAAVGIGSFLTSSSSITFTPDTLFAGAVYCAGQGASVAVSISEEKL